MPLFDTRFMRAGTNAIRRWLKEEQRKRLLAYGEDLARWMEDKIRPTTNSPSFRGATPEATVDVRWTGKQYELQINLKVTGSPEWSFQERGTDGGPARFNVFGPSPDSGEGLEFVNRNEFGDVSAIGVRIRERRRVVPGELRLGYEGPTRFGKGIAIIEAGAHIDGVERAGWYDALADEVEKKVKRDGDFRVRRLAVNRKRALGRND